MKKSGSFLVEIMEQPDTRAIEPANEGGGSPPYPPGMILVLLFYYYAKGIFSRRKPALRLSKG